jgi:HD-GYP domain-containing protein (c-di-GMP phosphodiesterase class II)
VSIRPILDAGKAHEDQGRRRGTRRTGSRHGTALQPGCWLVKSQRIILAAEFDDGDTIGLIARHHHERYDGAGYPDGLAGEAIPIMARIIALADTYDAMARTRVYRRGLSHDRIMRTLYDEQGRQHDAYLFQKLVELMATSRYRARAERL